MKIILVSTLLSVCFTFGLNAKSKTEEVLGSEDQIFFAVFDEIIRKPSPDESIFVAVNGYKDPGRALLEKLRKISKQIKPNSECRVDVGAGDTVIDSAGKPGIRYAISKMRWIDKTHVQLDAGSYIGNMGSDSCRYSLQLKEGVWEITGRDNCVIS